MTAEPPESPVTEAVRSLEVRWIFPGQLQAAVAGWFGRFPARTESREDAYLLDPPLPGLSVKIRSGRALEVKAYLGSPGILQVAGRARGLMEGLAEVVLSLQPSQPRQRRPGRLEEGPQKAAHHRVPARPAGPIAARAPGPGQQPQCEAELTEVRACGQDWWTLGFEATGPAGLLRSEIEAAATLVFAQALPGRTEPGLDESRSYAGWLSQR